MFDPNKYEGDCQFLNNIFFRIILSLSNLNCGHCDNAEPYKTKLTDIKYIVNFMSFCASCSHFRITRKNFRKKNYISALFTLICELLVTIFYCIVWLILFLIGFIIFIIFMIIVIVVVFVIIIIVIILLAFFFVINCLLCCVPLIYILFLCKSNKQNIMEYIGGSILYCMDTE